MSDRSGIEWTEATWNPVTGCTEVSPGCNLCYAKTFAERWRGTPGHYYERGFDVLLRPEKLDQPIRWARPRRIFVNSMSDLFHQAVPDDYIAKVWGIMAQTPRHTFQVLTKRHARMHHLMNSDPFRAKVFHHGGRLTWPLPNVWLGVSTEDQRWADNRIAALLDSPAAVRWISAEPLLSRIGLSMHHRVDTTTFKVTGLDWVVAGGESGRGARPMHPDWARSLHDQCRASATPFMFKQWGSWAPIDGEVEPKSDRLVFQNGQSVVVQLATQQQLHRGDYVVMRRGTKKANGRLLDGVLYDEYPVVAS